jgi:hypothetical protein
LVAIADTVAGRPRSRASKRSSIRQLRHLRSESESDSNGPCPRSLRY